MKNKKLIPIDNTYVQSHYSMMPGHFGADLNIDESDLSLAERYNTNSLATDQMLKNQKIQIILSIAFMALIVYLNFFKKKSN